MTIDELELLLKQPEGANLEFKAAKNSFNEDKDLPDYCAALANEKGGKLILGVNNMGNILGTKVYGGTLNKIPHEIFSKLKIRIEISEIPHPNGRVLVFDVPSRPVGQIVASTGKYKYPMRVGESLAEMNPATIRQILNENDEFTSNIVVELKIEDLDKRALDKFRRLWASKSGRKDYLKKDDKNMLQSLSLLRKDGLTYAALILLGKENTLQQHLSCSEIIFEWRTVENKIAYDFRKNWRDNFIGIFDEIWEIINARNIRFPIQEGFIQKDIWAFDEKSIREAILNAVAHRDYRDNSRSIFIKASPESFNIKSPGGLVYPVTLDNIIYSSAWRNRLLAETLEKIGLVERSGQGIDDIFDKTLKDGKGSPKFIGTDETTVCITIPAKIEDKKFVGYLEKIAKEKKIDFKPEEIIELENIRKAQKIKDVKHKEKFIKLGIIESVGQGRATKYILSHQYYLHDGRLGIYTRLIGTSREEKKILILKHLKNNLKAKISDFQDLFPDLSKKEIQNLLQELRQQNRLIFIGNKRSGFWHVLTS